jgi:hypothetical protein
MAIKYSCMTPMFAMSFYVSSSTVITVPSLPDLSDYRGIIQISIVSAAEDSSSLSAFANVMMEWVPLANRLCCAAYFLRLSVSFFVLLFFALFR